ncbi:hypothetical protein EXU57_08765 [Segetibacter sp. 3557_3]|uniref:hypothetical protein n=1 Tax=Segetibacter sp. 3557_3 TaxID=2547429 RepID=UPI0010591838|nr:hypothetical protein [Segetibacter sp. 3557_3]TDH26887.1 hypothetical protein EXU57_08765 [Segetibacter sp. 3557_3]
MRKRVFLMLATAILIYGPSYACTIFGCSLHGEVLIGANEDNYNPFSKIWFNPSTKDRFGSVCFGFPDLQAQAAMNEHGLFFDFTAQYDIDPSKLAIKYPYYGDLFFEIIGRCKNVGDVLDFLKTHNYAFGSQVLIADAQGRSAVINAGTIVEKKGAYQINTNFNISRLPAKDYQCMRFDIAEKMLTDAKTVSVSLFKDILSRTRQEGELSTQYSQIFDLKRGIIHVYLFHDFQHDYVIDLKQELKKGYRMENLADHFPKSFAFDYYVTHHPEYPRELMLEEIKAKGIDKTLSKYQQFQKDQKATDSINMIYMDAAMVLLKKAYNAHSNGGWLSYWQKFPSSYFLWRSNDEKIHASLEILKVLQKEGTFKDPFFTELLAYANLVAGNRELARKHYNNVIITAKTESDTYVRAQNMLRLSF